MQQNYLVILPRVNRINNREEQHLEEGREKSGKKREKEA